jgi:FAD synthetase
MKKIITVNKILITQNEFKKLNNKIVLIGGCFDILHLGHIRLINQAKKLGDILIIFLESDQKIKKLKGDKRPINSQIVRAEILSSLENVDYVVMLPGNMKNEDYDLLVKKINPDFIATTRNDSNLEFKKRAAKTVGAKVVAVTDFLEGYSTGKIIDLFC